MSKKYFKIIQIVIILLSLQFQIIYAQSTDLEFQHFTTADGLVTNWMVRCPLEQDAQGFIWIGTDHGLHKYDGYNFTIYTHDENDSTSISSNSILDLYRDSKGRLWIGTNSGLNEWQPETESFKKYFFTDNVDSGLAIVRETNEDQKGNLWLRGEKIFLKYNPDTKEVMDYRKEGDQIRSLLSNINISYMDKDDIFWIGGENGLVKFNPETSEITHFDLRNAKFNNSQNNTVTCIAEDLSGRLLLGGENILYYFDRKTETIETLHNLKNNSISIWAPKTEGKYGSIKYIFQSSTTKEYWISTDNAEKVNRFDASGKLIHQYNHDFTRTILEDRSGVLWLGTVGNGIYKSKLSASNFEPQSYGLAALDILSGHHILSVMEDNIGNLWISTADGILYKYNLESKKLTDYSLTIAKTNNLENSPIPFIFQDSKSRIWIGTLRGLSLFEPKTNSFATYYVDPETKSSEYNYFVAAYEDTTGNLTFGIWKYPENYVRYYSFKFDKNTGKGMFTHNPDYKPPDLVLENNGGKVKTLSESIAKANIPNTQLTTHSVLEDKNGIVWVTATEGLIKYNPVSYQYKVFTTENGLPVNTMGGMLEDDNGCLWVANSAGLLKINPDDDSFIQFGKEDGLDNNLFEEQKAAFKSKSGLLYFGGFNGLTVIAPKRFKANTVTPEVQITGFEIFGKSVSISKDGILRKSITFSNQLELEYNQNDITIDYVGLHYKNPKRNKYAYKLEPYEKEWNYVEDVRNAHYTNLSAGDYTFYVKASNSDGIWNEQGKQLAIIINPPPWATWWAYTFYLLFAGLILYSIRRFELNRQKKNSEIKESKLRAEAAELQAKAAEAQANVIQAENDRKTKELEEARELQLSMLPKEIPQLPNLDIAVYMQTATEVGGDYYDFSIKYDELLNICLGDATGHGMKAGTLVSMMKSLFTADSVNKNIEDFFITSNNGLKNSKLDKMMMAFAMLNIDKDNKIQIANAGIPPIYISRKNTDSIEEINLKGLPLGAMKNTRYEIYESELNIGDTILMLSDGMPELRNKDDEMFGYERLKRLFAEIAINNSNTVIEKLKEAISKWSKGKVPDDDITFVVIKVK